ncbi:WSC domain-containing protein ARB_07870-like [Haliotis rufescens]|uniref:WSC domain-containing protein ARB_07870-like n=1 Tax=Haliotis rufescens TaxID=6454 RepID=UPI00201EF2BF|nr:WSC domain-containing protein ARB_07870-like [Haliotis rufescens]
MTCHNRPCKEKEVCVPVEAGVKYLCLAPGVTTSTTAAPVTATTTTATTTATLTSTTSRTTPITTTTMTLSTTTTTTPITATTTTLSTTTTTTPTTPTTNQPTTPPTTTSTTPCPEDSHTYVGCYEDDASRVLPGSHLVRDTDLTIETCKLHCHGINDTHFGVENGRECFCGDVIKGWYRRRPDTECNVPCTGDRSTMCGGDWRMSIYKIYCTTAV